MDENLKSWSFHADYLTLPRKVVESLFRKEINLTELQIFAVVQCFSKTAQGCFITNEAFAKICGVVEHTIVEGPADVWKLGPGAVALLGIDWKIEQALLLRHFKRRYIMFDPENAAQKRAKELAYWLSAFPVETWIISETETDAEDMSEKNAKKIMQEFGL